MTEPTTKPKWIPPNAGKGRPKGSKNKTTLLVANIFRDLVNDEVYRKNLQKRLRAGTLAPHVEALCWHYAYGKPKETVAFEDPDGRPLGTSLAEMSVQELHAKAADLAARLATLSDA